MFQLPKEYMPKTILKIDLGTLIEGEPYMAIAKVVPLFNANNEQRGFKILSIIKIDRKKKEKDKEKDEKAIFEFMEDVEI